VDRLLVARVHGRRGRSPGDVRAALVLPVEYDSATADAAAVERGRRQRACAQQQQQQPAEVDYEKAEERDQRYSRCLVLVTASDSLLSARMTCLSVCNIPLPFPSRT